jgi:hypothetical protein
MYIITQNCSIFFDQYWSVYRSVKICVFCCCLYLLNSCHAEEQRWPLDVVFSKRLDLFVKCAALSQGASATFEHVYPSIVDVLPIHTPSVVETLGLFRRKNNPDILWCVYVSLILTVIFKAPSVRSFINSGVLATIYDFCIFLSFIEF